MNRMVERFKIEIKGHQSLNRLQQKFGFEYSKIAKYLRVSGWRLLLVDPDTKPQI